VDRRRAAVRYALASGLEDQALAVAGTVVEELDGSRLRGFLADLARRGEEGGSDDVALWAYRELRARTGNEAERRALDQRLASAALEAGDTARALQIRRELVEALPADSRERRQARAELLELEAAEGRVEGLEEGLESFRRTYPRAAELDGLSARVARALLGRGDRAGARRVLEGEEGPRAALTRAYLHLAEGALDRGGELLDSASSGLPPSRATEVLQLRALLGGLQGSARDLVARTAVLAHAGRGGAAVERIREEVGTLPPSDQPAVLAHGARTADAAGDPDSAARLRRTLVESHPEARETGEAMLELARYHAGSLGETDEAMRLLETLIVERPHAPVVPVARRELERLRRLPDGTEGG
jgi:tetratricopeptide (TPR) repeat protein